MIYLAVGVFEFLPNFSGSYAIRVVSKECRRLVLHGTCVYC
jgi:hypothetical protein